MLYLQLISIFIMIVIVILVIIRGGKSNSILNEHMVVLRKENVTLYKELEELKDENGALYAELIELKNENKRQVELGKLAIHETKEILLEKEREILNGITTVNDIFKDKKLRGNFGEVSLYLILSNGLGDTSLWVQQYKLSNRCIVDAVVFAPEPVGRLCIDSKFPLESYKAICSNKDDKNAAKRQFIQDMKRHIDTIAEKYIIRDETADYAIMFVPSEGIFSEAYINFDTIITYAYKKKVWLASPTTLMAILVTLQAAIRKINIADNHKTIAEELGKLSVEFDRFSKRWNKLTNTLDTVDKETRELSITVRKIINKFVSLETVEYKNDVERVDTKSISPIHANNIDWEDLDDWEDTFG